ncbi:molybdate ABC transporter substrate-binding protein [Oricola thermophila]|uniref:Molybdate ABC transporter substrate-binding protein n=1 Tax=Oricola thermophila TaxID=2742145 RepID=A0A6N1VMX0_9HYPH|nr:molybdate ABC transporter substrate-binding protein [Oricola thermophila]QKV20337.1 molybdate ABC transporter substrate-binding protein [Oricola thermophila]
MMKVDLNMAAIARSLVLAMALLAAPQAGAETVCGDEPLTVFAAASLADAVGEIATAYESKTGCTAAVSTAGTSTLARQIAVGAPADIFLSANRDWVAWLREEAPTRLAGSPRTFARNALVIVSRPDTSAETGIAALLSTRFAMGDPGHVPAGIYAKAALSSLGLWDDIARNAVFTENVRVALALAARGDVGAAIVYATDATMESTLAVAHAFNPSSHPEIAYEAVLLTDGGAAGQAFLDLLSGSEGQAILARFGFLPGDEPGNG